MVKVKEYNSGVAKGAKGFKVSQVDERHATIELSLDGIGISMNYPRDKDSVFFITEPEWLGDDLNAQLIGGKLKTLDQILAAIARVNKAVPLYFVGLNRRVLLFLDPGFQNQFGFFSACVIFPSSSFFFLLFFSLFFLAVQFFHPLGLENRYAQRG